MRLDKFLANSGIGSRKEVKELIKQGLVFVNDERIKNSDKNIDEIKDIIKIRDKCIEYRKYVYIMLNKPQNVISATEDNKHKTVIDLIKGYDTYNIFPVGRLDIDTEGLLLLTNDGKLSHNLLSPKKHVEKEYFVKLKENINDIDINKVENNIELEDGYICKKAKIKRLSKNELNISITEGKFHQVKRMFKAVGNEVIFLKRVRMANILLDKNLKSGEYRELTEDELKGLI
jgi:pseudouridylate synthase